MSETIHIEPCPFCGCAEFDAQCVAAVYASVEPSATSKDGGLLRVNVDGFGWYWVMCGECHAQGPKYHGGERHDRGITGPKNYRRVPDKTRAAIAAAIIAWNDRETQARLDLGVCE